MIRMKNKFKFILNKEKFDYEVDDTVFEAELIGDLYIVSWYIDKEIKESVNYNVFDVVEDIKDGYWLVVEE